MKYGYESAQNKFCCQCKICEIQTKGIQRKEDVELKEKDDIATFEGQGARYSYIVQLLGKSAVNQKIVLNIPDTLGFENGRPVYFLQYFKRQLKFTESQDKLSLHDLYKLFTNIVARRKTDKFVNKANSPSPFGRIIKKSVGFAAKPPNQFVKEVAILKYAPKHPHQMIAVEENGATRILLESDLRNIMFLRPNAPFFRQIQYIQTVLKCKQGLGDVKFVTYYSHEASDSTAVQELQKAGQDINLESERKLMQKNPKEYCMLICRRIAYYLATYHQIELLRLKAEFMADDDKKLWFTGGSRISVRQIKVDDEMFALMFNRIQLISPISRQRVEGVVSEGKTTEKSIRVKQYMEKFYEQIKEENQIEGLEIRREMSQESIKAFAHLRPHVPYKLDDIFSGKFVIASKQRKTHRRVLSLQVSPKASQKRLIRPPSQWKYKPRIRSKYSSTACSSKYES